MWAAIYLVPAVWAGLAAFRLEKLSGNRALALLGLSVVAILALTATAGKLAKSRVVLRLTDGYVTSAQSDVDVIATEYGTADIRATTLAERRSRIAALAEPRFRAALAEGQEPVHE